MPIYEYRCEACGHEFERLQSFHDEPVSTCPECSQDRCRRLISAPGIVFKGSGWYIKDSKRRGASTGAATDTSSTAEDKGTGDGGDKGGDTDKGGGGDAGDSSGDGKADGPKDKGGASDASSATSGGKGGSSKDQGSGGSASKAE